jgi:hypothetical protein
MSSKKRLETNLKKSREREKHLLTAVEQGMQDENQSTLLLRVKQLEAELKEVTASKDAEIDELRQQLSQSSKPQPSLENDQDTTQLDEIRKEHKLEIDKLQRQWNLERNSLRQEVQRLNLENSRYRNGREAEISLEKYEEDEEEEELMRYELPRRESSGRLDFILGVSAMEEIKCSSSVDVNDNAETPYQVPIQHLLSHHVSPKITPLWYFLKFCLAFPRNISRQNYYLFTNDGITWCKTTPK